MKKFLMFSIILVFGLFFYVPAWAETTDGITSSDYLILGTVEGTGIHFEVADSEYLNVTLDSSETITLRLESVPEMVTMYIEPALAATSTQITVIGFLASTKYYKYEDDYHNLVEFTTDGNGSYSWTQDISQSHLVFIQPRKSTKFIRNDSTGGDCYLIGEWNWSARTCTLTSDVNETIQIDSSYVTLDGNGHTVTGAGTGHGIQVTWKKGVTIKNLTIEGFISGINPLFSTNSTFTGNTISNNIFGIEVVYDSINNTFTGNSISSNNIGIYLDPLSHSNTLSGNTVQYSDRGIYIHSYSNILTDNTTVSNGYGINLGYESSGNTLTNNTASNNSYGIYLGDSSNNILTTNIVSNNRYGIILGDASYSILTNNTVSNNQYGVYIWYFSRDVTLTELINQFLISGYIDNSGIANSLISMLNNALDAKNNGNDHESDNIMQAFINYVEAQSGNQISESTADILINAATYIINN